MNNEKPITISFSCDASQALLMTTFYEMLTTIDIDTSVAITHHFRWVLDVLIDCADEFGSHEEREHGEYPEFIKRLLAVRTPEENEKPS